MDVPQGVLQGFVWGGSGNGCILTIAGQDEQKKYRDGHRPNEERLFWHTVVVCLMKRPPAGKALKISATETTSRAMEPIDGYGRRHQKYPFKIRSLAKNRIV